MRRGMTERGMRPGASSIGVKRVRPYRSWHPARLCDLHRLSPRDVTASHETSRGCRQIEGQVSHHSLETCGDSVAFTAGRPSNGCVPRATRNSHSSTRDQCYPERRSGPPPAIADHPLYYAGPSVRSEDAVRAFRAQPAADREVPNEHAPCLSSPPAAHDLQSTRCPLGDRPHVPSTFRLAIAQKSIEARRRP